MNNNLKHYVEEIWTELDYKEGIKERKITFPITKRENYKALPWVKEYRFFDLEKTNNNISQKLNTTHIIHNKNYNPVYFMDDQHKMIFGETIDINLVHYVKEIWIEFNYSTKEITEREVILSIKNREEYTPDSWVKQYKFVDFLKININGNIKIYETPINETEIYFNKETYSDQEIKSIDKKELISKNNSNQIKTNYLNKEIILSQNKNNQSKRKFLTPTNKKYNTQIIETASN